MTSIERNHPYSSVPQVVGIETINVCNARCPFCPLFQGKDTLDRSLFPATTMSQDLFEKVVTDIAKWREAPQVIYLNMNGEPLLDRFFEKRLIVLRKHGIHRLINIQSNGEFLDEKKAEAILSNAIGAISIGFDGATKDTYERHRVNCHYERVMENIKRFVRLRRKLGSDTQVVIKCVVTPKNIHELLQIAELFRDLLDSGRDLVDASLSLNWGSSWLETSGFIFDTVAPLRQAPAAGCQLFASQLVILANGAIAACCFDYNLKVRPGPIANAEEEDLLAIWNGKARREILRLLVTDVIARKPPKCRECTFSYKRKPLRA